MKSSRIPTSVLAVLCASAVLTFAAAAPGAPRKGALDGPPGIGVLEETGLFRHTGAYPPLALAWQVDGRVSQAVGVFPHPALPDRVAVATRGGLLFSDDSGANWKALGEAAAARVGVVRHVAFSPVEPEAFLLATDHKGVWMTADGGKTFRQVGSKQAGMASDDCAAVYHYPRDRRFETLLAIHGESAPGISFSHDGGRSWRVVAPEYCVRQILCGNPGDRELLIVASRKTAPDVQCIYYCISFDDYWVELVRDVVPTDAARSVLLKPGQTWTEEVFHGAAAVFSTADGGLCRVKQGEGARIGPADVRSLSSVGFTWGPTADTQVCYAYDPRKLGLLMTADNFQTVSTQSAGLYTGPFVKEGARVRANANGTAFFACVNDALYVGRREAGPMQVVRVAVTPAVVTYQAEGYKSVMAGLREELQKFSQEKSAASGARSIVRLAREAKAYVSETQFTVTAAVAAQGGPPASVTVDLSRVGGSGLTPMYDDGASGDGAAGDGVYGVRFRLDPKRLTRDNRDWRHLAPGELGLTVTAAARDGKLAGAVAVLSVFERPESFSMARKIDPIVVTGEPWTRECGDVSFSKTFSDVVAPRDISGYHAMTFWIRTDASEPEEINVQLRDTPPYSLSTTTPPVAIVREGYVEGGKLAAERRRVTIPLARLLKDAPQFEIGRLGWVVLSGEGKSSGTYWVEDIRFHTSAEDLKAYEGVKPQ